MLFLAVIWMAAAAGCSGPGASQSDSATAARDGQSPAAQAADPQRSPPPAADHRLDSSQSAVRWTSADGDRDAGRVEGLAQTGGPGRAVKSDENFNPLRPGGAARPIRPGSGPSGGSAAKSQSKAAPGAKKAGKAKPPRPPFDPIAENGTYFKDWPRPKLALVITGRQDGYLEPCGCAGMDRMKGGMARRYTMLEDLRRKRGWPVVTLDVGGNVKGSGKQAELKFQIVADAMKKMAYDAVALGKSDLKFPAGQVGSQTAAVDGKESIFVSANVALFSFDVAGFTVQKRVVERGGVRVGVTAVLGKQFQGQINNSELAMIDPEAALEKIVREMQAQKCDLLILLAHATMNESVALAQRHPEFDVVVTSDGASEAPIEPPQKIGAKTLLVEVGEKGMAAVVLGFYSDTARPVRYQRVLLDSRYAAAPEMVKLMEGYQSALEKQGLEGLGIRPMPNPRADLLGAYVGSAKCESCHEESYRVWRKSKHATAYKTLVQAKPGRNFDPECLACHVIGWDPEHFTPYEGGYWNDKKTPELINVGCESCHGPGEAHCVAETKNDPALQKKMQQAAVVTKEESEKRQCATCHDGDNSPDFKFETYWPEVEHREPK